jgi:hypothetical protein
VASAAPSAEVTFTAEMIADIAITAAERVFFLRDREEILAQRDRARMELSARNLAWARRSFAMFESISKES